MKNKIILILIFFIAICFRWWLISDNQIYFWYDQARDAHVAQQIFLERDIKIQGPSASGTNDTIYHGVIYYYLIGFIYTIFNGNPFSVALTFGLINSLAIFLIYFLIEKVFNNKKMALIGAFLLAINFEHAQYSTWLSNPMMSLLPILIFFFLVWKLFYQFKTNQPVYLFVILGCSLGLIEQSAFYSIYFFSVILIGLFYLINHKKLSIKKIFSLKQIAIFIFSYILTISTMLLTQFKLFKAGIFNWQSLTNAVDGKTELVNLRIIEELLVSYLTKIIETIAPNMTLYGFILFIFILVVFFKKSKKSFVYFLLSWIFAPLWLFVIQFRNSPHMLIGVEYALLIFLAFLINYLILQKKYLYQLIVFIILLIYALSQLKAVHIVREQSTSIFTFQTGVMLNNELKVLDRTYQLTNNQPFSISVWGSPYEYYITWAYLYNWYGKNKYGYLPSYFGSNQSGKYGEELLKQKNQIGQVHFLIEEPEIVLIGDIYKQFIYKQNEFSKLKSSEKIGEYKLEIRETINKI